MYHSRKVSHQKWRRITEFFYSFRLTESATEMSSSRSSWLERLSTFRNAVKHHVEVAGVQRKKARLNVTSTQKYSQVQVCKKLGPGDSSWHFESSTQRSFDPYQSSTYRSLPVVDFSSQLEGRNQITAIHRKSLLYSSDIFQRNNLYSVVKK